MDSIDALVQLHSYPCEHDICLSRETVPKGLAKHVDSWQKDRERAEVALPSEEDFRAIAGLPMWEAVSFSSVLLYTLVVIPWPTLFALYLLGVNLFVT